MTILAPVLVPVGRLAVIDVWATKAWCVALALVFAIAILALERFRRRRLK